MFIVDFFSWWYGVGWFQRAAELKDVVYGWIDYFSFSTLLRTLFSPWKQIVTQTDGHSSLDAKKNAVIDNIVSRFVGFTVRSAVLFFGVLFVIGVVLVRASYVFFWPFVPVLPLLVIVFGVLL